MATAEVQHPVPTAVHDDGSCFQEEGKNLKVPVQDDVLPATKVVEDAADADGEDVQQQVHANGLAVAEEETKVHQDREDSDKENNPKDHHDADEAVAADDAGDADDCLVRAVEQEVEAKLGIVQDDVESAETEADVHDEVMLPKEKEAEPRRAVPSKAAGAAKAVVVPVVDDDDGLVDGKAAAEAAPDAPAEKRDDEE